MPATGPVQQPVQIAASAISPYSLSSTPPPSDETDLGVQLVRELNEVRRQNGTAVSDEREFDER